jgi:hypothetical protein
LHIPTITNSFELQRKTYFCYKQKSGKPISAVCLLACLYQFFSVAIDKPHLSSTAETGFLHFKELVPCKCNYKIPAAQCKRKTFQLIPFMTFVGFLLDRTFNVYKDAVPELDAAQ